MIVDSSAVLAALYRESDAKRFEELMATAECRLSVANALEVAIEVEGRGGVEAGQEFDAFLESTGIELAAGNPVEDATSVPHHRPTGRRDNRSPRQTGCLGTAGLCWSV